MKANYVPYLLHTPLVTSIPLLALVQGKMEATGPLQLLKELLIGVEIMRQVNVRHSFLVLMSRLV